jgi:hypothetical protein
MPRCSAVRLDFRIIPAEFNTRLGFESQRLEFLTGFTELLSLILAAWIMGGIGEWVGFNKIMAFQNSGFSSFLFCSHMLAPRVPGHPQHGHSNEGISHYSIRVEGYFLL